MAQQAVERVERHNYARTGRMALYGGGNLFSAPIRCLSNANL